MEEIFICLVVKVGTCGEGGGVHFRKLRDGFFFIVVFVDGAGREVK